MLSPIDASGIGRMVRRSNAKQVEDRDFVSILASQIDTKDTLSILSATPSLTKL